MAVAFVRTVIMYVVILIVLRFSGKRQLGELQLSELVVTILISELAAIPMQDFNAPIFRGIISMITLVCLEIIISFICMKSIKFREMMEGHPSIIMKNGKVIQKEMEKVRLTMDDLIEAMHQNGISDISQIDCAILETNGKISIFQKSSYSPITPSAVNMKVEKEKTFHTAVIDGKINKDIIEKLGTTKESILKRLNNNGIKKLRDVYYLGMSDTGEIRIIKREKK